MEAATLFTLAAARGVQAAALLVVSDIVLPERVRIGPDELRAAERRMGAGGATRAHGRRSPALSPWAASALRRLIAGVLARATPRSAPVTPRSRSDVCPARSPSRASRSAARPGRGRPRSPRAAGRRSATGASAARGRPADGRLSALIASSWARVARSRVSNAADSARLTTGLSSIPWVTLPIASSPWRVTRPRSPCRRLVVVMPTRLSFVGPKLMTALSQAPEITTLTLKSRVS